MQRRLSPPVVDHALPERASRIAWRPDRVLGLLAAAFFLIYSIFFIGRYDQGEWHSVYTTAARHMLDHEGIHAFRNGYSYPPAMAFLATPLARLSPRVSLLAWYLVNVWALCTLFLCAWRLAGGPSLARMPPAWRIICGLSLFLVYRFVMATLELQQFDIVIAALVMLGCCRLWHGQDLAAGGWLGVATALKCTPLLFAPYLLWRGRFRAAAVLVAVALGLNLLPDLVFPQVSGGTYVGDWYRMYLSGMAHAAPGFWHSDLRLNQSLGGMFNRLLRCVCGTPTLALSIPLPAAATLCIRVLTYGTSLVLVALTTLRMGRPLRRAVVVPIGTPGPFSWNQLQTGCEASAVLVLMLLLSPMSGKAHFVVLMLPILLFARQLVERPSRWLWISLPVLSICGPLTAKGLTGKWLGDLTLIWGMPTWFALLLLASTWTAMRAARGLGSRGLQQQLEVRGFVAKTTHSRALPSAG